ncbi:MAG: glycosyltransferase [Actinomycetota bacterium]|nr:glycosyltransferase [Actinomycetota bacterium]
MAHGLADLSAELTLVLPRPCARDLEDSPYMTVRLAAPGGRAARQVAYEMSRCALFLRWWVTGRRVDLWISRHSFLGLGLLLARLVARRVVLEVNGPIREEIEANQGSRVLAALSERLMLIQARASHLVVAVTPGLQQYLSARVPGARCEVVANGATPRQVGRSQRQTSVPLVFAGALTPWYELEVPLQALQQLRANGLDLRLDVLGDGARFEELQQLATELGVGDLVQFVGWVDPQAVQQHLDGARVGLLPLRTKHASLDAVGSPIKLYEYVASGLRVVGTDIDGITNAPVMDSVDVYEPGDPTSCAAAIREALSQAGGRPLPEATWSWSARAAELLEHVGSLDGERPLAGFSEPPRAG